MTREFFQGQRANHRSVTGVALIVLVGVGCFSDPDLNKVHCKAPGSDCPDGFGCKVANGVGRCCRPDDPNCGTRPLDGAPSEIGDSAKSVDGQAVDLTVMDDSAVEAIGLDDGSRAEAFAVLDVPGTADVADAPAGTDGPVAPDAPIDSVPDLPLPPSDGSLDMPHDAGPPVEVGSTDVPPLLKAQGQPCGQGSECSSTHCSDGVCCDKDCSGCSACTKALTGRSDGTCASVSNGLDPHLTCGTSCSSGTLTTLVCDGSGTCATGSSGTCPGNVQCASATACLGASCSNDTQCGSGYRCSAGTCVPKKTLGVACGSGSECSGGNCVDGFCCGSSSCPQCQACTGPGGTCAAATSQNGQQCSSANTYCHDGTCTACTPNAACNSPTNNLCEIWQISCSTGAPVCNKGGNQQSGYSCGAGQTCSGSTLTSARTCNGSGSCGGGNTSNCLFGCSSNSCFPGLTNGQSCTTSSQCQSGHCSIHAQKTCQQDCGTGSACCDQSDCPSDNLCDTSGLCESCGAGLGAQCCPNSTPKCQQLGGQTWVCINNGQSSLPFGYCTLCGGSGAPCCTETTACQNGACLPNGTCP